MDPNATLRQMDYIIDVKINGGLRGITRKEARSELKELREALKGWLKAGGFEPDWAAYPLAAKLFRK